MGPKARNKLGATALSALVAGSLVGVGISLARPAHRQPFRSRTGRAVGARQR